MCLDSILCMHLLPINHQHRAIRYVLWLQMIRYIPVIEDLNINVASQFISLESEVGPFQFLIKVSDLL